MKRLLILGIILLSAWFSRAQTPFTNTTKQAVVKQLQESLVANYIFLDTAQRMSNYIGERLKSGAYDKIGSPMEFAQALSTDLYHIYHDGHLAVRYDPRPQPVQDTSAGSEPVQSTPGDDYRNWGLKKVEVLYGNIGYLSLNQFADITEEAKTAVNAAFGLLKHTDALILDLRNNGGGDGEMVKYICSFFLPPNTHLNDIYERRTNKTMSFTTTLVDTSGHFQQIPVYVLTSPRTYSAAEECTYNLKFSRNAQVVGENTGGGAHPVQPFQLGDGFIGLIPFARSINPVTHTNWEGKGITPTIAVENQDALPTAMVDFLDKKLEETLDINLKRSRQWARDMAAAQLHPSKVNANTLKKYAGEYGNRQVKFDNGQLFITNQGGQYMPLIPVSDKIFRMDGYDYVKIIFSDDIKSVTMAYDEGFINVLKRKS
ncbi:S41 family peptidase [Chitinophaga sp. Cy-1792]|uniref:S41 family peptidase n=1 Tax=Chitinophaga sp. Cy-1792 TaxID=2608339 RepID=UPI00141FFB0E|nr:S41 family peptidase [Chitinophaga sp. Cy-1792]NIG56665.1 S41 family peptidase [Chitinophaga sp. Cy-1792]